MTCGVLGLRPEMGLRNAKSCHSGDIGDLAVNFVIC